MQEIIEACLGYLGLLETFPKLAPWMAKVWNLASAWLAVNIVGSAGQFVVNTVILVGWAGFLAIVTNGFSTASITALQTNPLSGLPLGMYQIFCAIFPFGFFFRMVIAYIMWNLTFQGAALTIMRGQKFIFGA